MFCSSGIWEKTIICTFRNLNELYVFSNLYDMVFLSVSLARRIQDPLAELVKVEPQHLGVGMYQHDLKKKTLEEALNDVVSECVSFVGVDLNTASQCLLR